MVAMNLDLVILVCFGGAEQHDRRLSSGLLYTCSLPSLERLAVSFSVHRPLQNTGFCRCIEWNRAEEGVANDFQL